MGSKIQSFQTTFRKGVAKPNQFDVEFTFVVDFDLLQPHPISPHFLYFFSKFSLINLISDILTCLPLIKDEIISFA